MKYVFSDMFYILAQFYLVFFYIHNNSYACITNIKTGFTQTQAHTHMYVSKYLNQITIK